MNLWFRLFSLLLRSAARKRTSFDPFAEVFTPFRCWPTDLDTNLHMNNGRYLTLMDLGRLDFMAKTGILWPSFRRGILAVLGASQMVYLKPLLVGRPFRIGTRLCCWDERWFVMQQRFLVGERTAAKATVRGMFRQRGQTVAPQAVMQLSGAPLPAAAVPPPEVASWLRSLAEQRDLSRAPAVSATGD
jgi:acyl-CoA thioesterase FadM